MSKYSAAVRRLLPLIAVAAACARDPLAPDKFGQIRSALPAFKDRVTTGGPASGTLERKDGKGAVVSLAWDPDERAGAPTETEALVVAGFAPGGAAAAAGEPIAAHAVVEVTAPDAAKTLVWRCEKSRRLLRLGMNEAAASKADLRSVATGVACHAIGDKAVNGEVPVADSALLEPAWHFERRQPASASWLREEAVLTLFAGQRAPGVRDLETASKIAPGWISAAGLTAAKLQAPTWTAGPARHQAIRIAGTAMLDQRPVRFTLLLWRCIARGKSHAAIVFSQQRPGATATDANWTGHDGALLATRCHG